MSENQERLEGRVARILNARELVINIGRAKGVRQKMRFAVLSAEPIQICEPDSEIVLDTIDREKTRVEVTEVREKVAICQTYRTKTIPGTTLSDIMNLIPDLYKPSHTVWETLAIKDEDLPRALSEEESFVKSGDRVVQLNEDGKTLTE